MLTVAKGNSNMGKDVSFKNHDRFVQIGLAIATLRKMRGLSQEKLTEKAGVSRSLIRFRFSTIAQRRYPSPICIWYLLYQTDHPHLHHLLWRKCRCKDQSFLFYFS